ncbi:hypothetical protein Syun_024035 [Stephania yunnanensis]|uniref:Transmembrane protein n=1 Tax=Stephania yunnanensis TaxID=152371 RepID=A0AAP0FR19_9MAGN
MENNQVLLIERHGIPGILKEALRIPYKHPKFITLTLLTSLPLFFIMVLHEIILQTTMIETKAFFTPPPPTEYPFYSTVNWDVNEGLYLVSYYLMTPLDSTMRLFKDMSPRILQLGILYLVPLHLLDLLTTITTLNTASSIYAGTPPPTLKAMLSKSVENTSFKGALITSIYVLSLNSFTLFGFMWAVTNSVIPALGAFFEVFYGVGSVVLFVKWMDWSAVWNMGIVLSILEGKHGLEAFWAALYYSRGSRTRGMCLMLVFFVWRTVLRLLCVYVGGYEKWTGLVITSGLSCIGNVLKWVVCMVFFYDCKSRVLEKKMDRDGSNEKTISNV